MTKGHPEQRARRIKIRPAYIVLLIAIGFFAFKFVEKTRELQQLNRQAAALRLANEQTLQDNARLQRNITYFRTDQYIQEQARALFGYKQPGDVTIMTNPVVPHTPVQSRPVYRVALSEPTWKEWWHSFFH